MTKLAGVNVIIIMFTPADNFYRTAIYRAGIFACDKSVFYAKIQIIFVLYGQWNFMISVTA